jgi:hypothetical protein
MDQQKLPQSRIFSMLTLIAFTVVLWIPLLQMWFHFVPESASTEKRTLEPKPELKSFSIKNIKDFLGKYETYYNDQFGFRITLVRWNNIFRIKYLKTKQQLSDVVIGKDGWLFYNNKDEPNLDDYCGLVPFTYEQLSEIQKSIEEDYTILKEKGIYYIIIVSPNKHTIYPEYLPWNIHRTSNQTRLDQLVDHLAGHSVVPFLDLRAPLLQAKHSSLLYLKTDTHWNTYGSFIAYQEIIKFLARKFPELHERSLAEYEIHMEKTAGDGDLAGMLSMKGMFEDLRIHMPSRLERLSQEQEIVSDFKKVLFVYKSFQTSCPDKLRLVMYHDSFGGGLKCFLSEHFSRCMYVHDVYGKYLPPYQVIDEEKPDIVIREVVERYLNNLRKPLFTPEP